MTCSNKNVPWRGRHIGKSNQAAGKRGGKEQKKQCGPSQVLKKCGRRLKGYRLILPTQSKIYWGIGEGGNGVHTRVPYRAARKKRGWNENVSTTSDRTSIEPEPLEK